MPWHGRRRQGSIDRGGCCRSRAALRRGASGGLARDGGRTRAALACQGRGGGCHFGRFASCGHCWAARLPGGGTTGNLRRTIRHTRTQSSHHGCLAGRDVRACHSWRPRLVVLVLHPEARLFLPHVLGLRLEVALRLVLDHNSLGGWHRGVTQRIRRCGDAGESGRQDLRDGLLARRSNGRRRAHVWRRVATSSRNHRTR